MDTSDPNFVRISVDEDKRVIEAVHGSNELTSLHGRTLAAAEQEIARQGWDLNSKSLQPESPTAGGTWIYHRKK